MVQGVVNDDIQLGQPLDQRLEYGTPMGVAFTVPDYPNVFFPAVCLKDAVAEVRFKNFKFSPPAEYTKAVANAIAAQTLWSKPVPEQKEQESKSSSPASGVNLWVRVSDDVIAVAFDFLSEPEIFRLSRTCHLFKDVIDRKSLIPQRITRCFFTKDSFRDEVLGIGVEPELAPNDSTKVIGLLSKFDIISYSAYEAGLRTSVWNEKFTNFLPLYISDTHFKRAKEILVNSVCTILNVDRIKFSPMNVLEVCCMLQNKTIALVTSVWRKKKKKKQQQHGATTCTKHTTTPHLVHTPESCSCPALAS